MQLSTYGAAVWPNPLVQQIDLPPPSSFGGSLNISLRNVQIVGIPAICWAIWKTRNKAWFDGKLIKSHIDLICYFVVFIKYWAALNNDADQVALRAGAESLATVAMAVRETRPPLVLVPQRIDLHATTDRSLRKMKCLF
jgi:hypothetical protein